jgi:glutathione S-transferase
MIDPSCFRQWVPRPQPSQQLLDAFAEKYHATLTFLEQEASSLARAPFGIGHIALGCGLSYLDFRFVDLGWRGGYPQIAAWHASFAQRPSAKATEVVED